MKKSIKILSTVVALSGAIMLAGPSAKAQYSAGDSTSYYNHPQHKKAGDTVGIRTRRTHGAYKNADTTSPSEKAYKHNNQWKQKGDTTRMKKHGESRRWKSKTDTSTYKSKEPYKKANSQWKNTTGTKKDSL